MISQIFKYLKLITFSKAVTHFSLAQTLISSLRTKNTFVSMKLPIYENSSLSMKLPVYEKSAPSIKCPVCEKVYL